MTWIIKKVNRIPMHCGVTYESVCSLARGHMIRCVPSYVGYSTNEDKDFSLPRITFAAESSHAYFLLQVVMVLLL